MSARLEAESTLTDRYQTTVPEVVRRALRLQRCARIHDDIQTNGEVVLSRVSTVDDPVMDRFLDFLADDMKRHPERIQSLPSELVARVQSLVGHVEVDLDSPLPADDERRRRIQGPTAERY